MGCCGSKGKRPARGRVRRLKPKTAQEVILQMAGFSEPRAHILMCRPKYFGIDYSINPWMDIGNDADHGNAISQWNALKDKLRELGARVQCVPPREGLPDMVFTANAGLILKDSSHVVLSSFHHKERQGEEEHFRQWFEQNGYTVTSLHYPFEGAGDALYFGDVLVHGYGFRSDERNQIELDGPVQFVRLVDPFFYHLDTCFCPLNDMDYLIWEGAFEDASPIRSLGGKEISVSEEDARKFACNSVCIGKDIVIPSGCESTMEKLREFGYTPHEVEMTEFMKSGGACKCLTLAL